MTGTEMAVGATLVKVGIELLRTAPTGIAWISSLIKGREIMVVGQKGAGKTTFIDYLRFGLFEDEKAHQTTKESVEHKTRFNIKMGRDQSLELSVKRVVDLAGQIGPLEHARLVFERRPHAVLIFTDLTRPLNGESERAAATWVREFCEHLENKWRANRKRNNRIQCIILVMNKRDKVDVKRVNSRQAAFRKILAAELHEARGRMIDEIAIIPCALVTNPDGTKAVDALIAHLAKTLAR